MLAFYSIALTIILGVIAGMNPTASWVVIVVCMSLSTLQWLGQALLSLRKLFICSETITQKLKILLLLDFAVSLANGIFLVYAAVRFRRPWCVFLLFSHQAMRENVEVCSTSVRPAQGVEFVPIIELVLLALFTLVSRPPVYITM